MDMDGIDYLLDYIIRIYRVDTFNCEDLIFLILPFPRHYSKIVSLSRYSLLIEPFKFQPGFPFKFIGNLCIKKAFFLLFMGYFDFYAYLSEFIKGVLSESIKSVQNVTEELVGRFYIAVSRLIEFNEVHLAVEIYTALSRKTEVNMDDLKQLVACYISDAKGNEGVLMGNWTSTTS
jgi:hypothetical protein